MKINIGYPSEFWDRYKDGLLPEPIEKEINEVFERNSHYLNLPDDYIVKVGSFSQLGDCTRKFYQASK